MVFKTDKRGNRLNVTNEYLINLARKFKNRQALTEYSQKDMLLIRRRGITEVAFSHMESLGSKKKREVYVLHFENNKVYVGLTCNFKKRFKDHSSSKKLGPLIKKGYKKVRDKIFLNCEDAIKKETETVERLKSQGFNVLNRAKPGSLGGSDFIWDLDKCLDVARSCESLKHFRESYPGAMGWMKKNGHYDKLLKILPHSRKGIGDKITEKDVYRVASYYENRSDFYKEERRYYDKAIKLGILEDVTKHMPIKEYRNRTHTIQDVFDIANTCSTRNEFNVLYSGVVKAAHYYGIYDDCTSHMPKIVVRPRKFSDELILNTLKKSKFKNQIPPEIIRAAKNRGLWGKNSKHLPYRTPKKAIQKI